MSIQKKALTMQRENPEMWMLRYGLGWMTELAFSWLKEIFDEYVTAKKLENMIRR